jgi:peptidoglycan/xylan/chitin deacetylase (PgdA/CDA1 family)
VNAQRDAGGAAADVERWRRDQASLATLPLGAFDEASIAQVTLRRLLLTLRVPPALVAPLARHRALRRTLDSYRYWREVRRSVDTDTWQRLTQGTTILMYHAFGVGDEPPNRFVVTRREFARQMRWLARRRPVLSLGELLDHRRSNRLPPAGSVVVTVDDGYEDVRTEAHPVLRELGLRASMFVVTDRMGDANRWDDPDGPLLGRQLMSWDDARQLHQDGVELGAHTQTHPLLPDLPPERAEAEVAGSRDDLELQVREPVSAFAYPYGRWDERTAQTVAAAGFACALTARPGRNCAATPPYVLRRVEVRGDDSRLRFRLALTFGDSRVLERLLRRLKRR